MADAADNAPAPVKRGRPPKAKADPAAPGGIETPPDQWAKTNYHGPKPHFPVYGETWQETMGGPVKFFHGGGWYLAPPSEKGSGTGDAARAAMNAEAAEEPGPTGTQPVEGDESTEADLMPETDAVKEALLAADDEVPDAEELDPDTEEFEPIDAEGIESVAAEPEAAETVYDGTAERQFVPVGESDTESETSPVIERLETFAEDLTLDAGYLVEDCRDFMLDLFKTRPKPWSATPEGEQRDIAAAIEQTMTDFVRKVVETVRTDPNTQPIRCLLEGYSEKDGIKAALKVKAFTPEEEEAAVVGLHRARGKFVLVTVASVDDYRGGRDAETLADAPELGFEAGDDPDEDEDPGADLGD